MGCKGSKVSKKEEKATAATLLEEKGAGCKVANLQEPKEEAPAVQDSKTETVTTEPVADAPAETAKVTEAELIVKLAIIRFDGYYINPGSMGDRKYLRFYEEGNVVKSMTSSVLVGEEYKVEQDIKNGFCSSGVYEISGDLMSFSTTRRGDSDTIQKYNVRVLSLSELELSSATQEYLVNGIYTFVEGLKEKAPAAQVSDTEAVVTDPAKVTEKEAEADVTAAKAEDAVIEKPQDGGLNMAEEELLITKAGEAAVAQTAVADQAVEACDEEKSAAAEKSTIAPEAEVAVVVGAANAGKQGGCLQYCFATEAQSEIVVVKQN